MRKVASIIMAFILLLSVLNLSVSSHLCHGKVMAVKMSMTGQKASACGMENTQESSPAGSIFKNKCCSNESASLRVDHNYSPSFFKNIPVFQKEIHFSAILLADLVNTIVKTKTSNPIFSPPDILTNHSVDLATICVFRI